MRKVPPKLTADFVMERAERDENYELDYINSCDGEEEGVNWGVAGFLFNQNLE